MNFYKNWYRSPSTSVLQDPIERSRPNPREPGVAFHLLPTASFSAASWRIRSYLSNPFNYAAEMTPTRPPDINLPYISYSISILFDSLAYSSKIIMITSFSSLMNSPANTFAQLAHRCQFSSLISLAYSSKIIMITSFSSFMNSPINTFINGQGQRQEPQVHRYPLGYL